MKQTARIISTYTSDASGVASALFELGGMTVIHDASGCNSTYNTHDEPRWYDTDSLVFVSAMTEMDAILGDDEKLIGDIVSAAQALYPRFVAVCGTPIPMLVGTDFDAVAAAVEARTGIPALGLATNGMHTYVSGAGMALAAVARRFTDSAARCTNRRSVNVLGLTPLDFSVNGSDRSVRRLLEQAGWEIVSGWAMGSSLDALAGAGRAAVNLVVSSTGLPAAQVLRERFGTPWVAAAPFGRAFSETVLHALEAAADTGICTVPYTQRETAGADTVLIGESVTTGSLAAAITAERGIRTRVLCPTEVQPPLLAAGDVPAEDEDELIPRLSGARRIIADPLYRPICPAGADFIPLPSEAFSGRIYRQDIPDLVGRVLA